MLCNSRALLICSLCDYACASKEGQEHTFRQLVCKIDEESKGGKEITYDNEFSDSEVLVQVNVWVLTSLASHIAHDDVEFHAVLRRDLTSLTPKIAGALGTIRLDAMQAADLMEVLHPVEHVIFSTESNLMAMMGSDPHAFDSCYSNTIMSLTHLVMLVMTIVSGACAHETVVNLQSGTGSFVKGVDLLLNWAIATSTQNDNPAQGSA